MTNQLPLFYKKIIPLNKAQHGKMYVAPATHFKYTSDTNSVYIAAVEFPRAAREYPIVFGRAPNNSVFPVVLLGLGKNQNLYLGKKGEWLADYVPAYVRRYPFILASNTGKGDRFAVCIDESYAGFNDKKKGQRLFTDKGEESDLLKQSLAFLKEYQNHIQLTSLFCNNIDKLGLLEPVQANIQKAGKQQAMGGFLCVNRNKLKALTADQLMELMKSDQMELIYAHFSSLANFDRLLKKLD